MYLFIGLGNPGAKYSKNRHNLGFMIIDAISKEKSFPAFSKKENSYISLKKINGEKLILLKPDTFMNDSGLSALYLKSFYNLNNENIYVFHDEIDLEPSKIKIKRGGGHNGHNGLKSIDNNIGKDYHRIKIGVGRPKIIFKENRDELISKWVLSDFKKIEEEKWVKRTIDIISVNFEDLREKKFEKFLLNF